MKFFTLACDCNGCGGSEPMRMELEHEEDCKHKDIMFEAIRVFRSRELAEMEAAEYATITGEQLQVAEFEVKRI